jgi:putative Mg2+ transporter-C (MgtC) family protein
MQEMIGNIFGEWEFFFQLLLAAVYGGLIGLEREVHGRPAGLRTHILVCLGSAVIIVAFEKLQVALQAQGGIMIRMDPARAAAGIITGIGFLGAGTILKGKDFVKGLTTAASIWVVAAIGITLGLGEFNLATITLVFVLLALFVLDKIDISSSQYGKIHLEGKGGTEVFEKAKSELVRLGFEIKGYRLETSPKDSFTKLRFMVRFKERIAGPDVVFALARFEGIERVSWEK